MTRISKSNELSPDNQPREEALIEIDSGSIRLSVMEYAEGVCIEKNDVTLSDCLSLLKNDTMTWIQVYGVKDPQVIGAIGKEFELHPLVIDDIINTRQRSKLDIYGNQIFLVVRLLRYSEQDETLKDEQVSVVFGHNYLISFLETSSEVFLTVKERLMRENNRIRKMGADYLAYTLLDIIVDNYFIILEKFDDKLDCLEEELTCLPKPETILQIQHAKRELVVLRKAIWPLRDVVNRFLHIETPLVSRNTQIYLQDIYDHIVRTIDIIEGFRDVAAGMFDIYLSNINIRTNEIMKVLTIVSTIFVPLTFITSFYGMNFEFIPELHKKYAYPIVIFIMLSIALGMTLFFKRKKWI